MKIITSKDYLNEYDFVCGNLYDTINSNIKQFNLYYKYNLRSELESIKIQTPKLQLKNDISKSDISKNIIVLNIEIIDKKTSNFIQLIEKIYEIIRKKLKKEKKKKFEVKKCYNDNTLFLKINKDLRNIGIFNNDKTKIKLEDIIPYTEVKIIVEITNIWIDLEKKTYGINIDIKQIQNINKSINKCLIIESDSDEEVVKKEIVVQTCMFCNSICSVPTQYYNNIGKGGKGKGPPPLRGKGKGTTLNQTYKNNEVKEKPDINKLRAIPPTLQITDNDLLGALSKLKKVKKNDYKNDNKNDNTKYYNEIQKKILARNETLNN